MRLAVKSVTPPLLWAGMKAVKDSLRGARAEPRAEPPAVEAPPRSEWEYAHEGWTRPARGWDVEAIARAYRAKWPSFLAAVGGTGPLGINHEVPAGRPVVQDDPDAQHTVLAFGYVLARAALGRRKLSLLDWGGGPGHYAVLAHALLPEVELEYHSRDLPPLVALGRELLPEHAFHDDDACLARVYDLVVASSSIQYAEDWRAKLSALARAAGAYLYLARVPVALRSPSFAVLQRADDYGYETEYLGWVLNRDELLTAAAAAGLDLVRELLLPSAISATGAPEDPVGHRGFLFGPAQT
jgi:putative methyltransferase (TIGR04325 family)